MRTLSQALSRPVSIPPFYLEKRTISPPSTFKLSQRVFHNPHSQKSLGQVLSNEGNLSLLKSRLKELYPYIPPTIEKVRRAASEIFPNIANEIAETNNHDLRNLCSQKTILTYSDQDLTPWQFKSLKNKLKKKGGNGLIKEKPISLRALFETIEKELYVFMERQDVHRAHKNWKIVTRKDPLKKLTASNLSDAIQSVGSSCTAVREELYQKFGIDIGFPYVQRYAREHHLQVHDISTLRAEDIDKQYERALVEHYKGKKPTAYQAQELIERTYKKGRPSVKYIQLLTSHIMCFPQDLDLNSEGNSLPSYLSTATFKTLLDKLEAKAPSLEHTPHEAYNLFIKRLKAHVKRVYPKSMTGDNLQAFMKSLSNQALTGEEVQEKAQKFLEGEPLSLDHTRDLCSFVWGIKTKISGAEASLTDMQKSVMQKLYSSFYTIKKGQKNYSCIRKWTQEALLIRVPIFTCPILHNNLFPLEEKQALHEEELSELRAYCQYSLRSPKSILLFIKSLGFKLASEPSGSQLQATIKFCIANKIPIEPTDEQKRSLAEACKRLPLESPITLENFQEVVKEVLGIPFPSKGLENLFRQTLALADKG